MTGLEPILLLALLVSFLVVGGFLGVLGGGGSILAVPILVYGFGVGEHEAVATSLVVVGATAFASSFGHWRRGTMDLKIALTFAVPAMAGAWGGAKIGAMLPGNLLLMLFAGMMLLTSIFMWRGRKETGAASTSGPKPVWIIIEGLAVGAFTGLVGAGGGFLVVPALVLLGGLPMHLAIGTSLFIIGLKSGAGFMGYASAVTIDWGMLLTATAGALIGAQIGTRIATKLDPAKLRKGFAVFVFAIGVLMMGAELLK